jgi:beta-galactosidase
VATGQVQLSKPQPLAAILSSPSSLPQPLSTNIQVTRLNPSTLEIKSASSRSSWKFSSVLGALTGWTRHTSVGDKRSWKTLITEPPTLGLYRAVTDNDSHGHGREWRDRRMPQVTSDVRNIDISILSSREIQITVTSRIAPPVLAWGVDVTATYTFSVENDSVHIRVKAKPHGLRLPRTFARFGFTLGIKDVEQVRWWGRGPGESYRDKKQAQLFGRWSVSDVDDLWTDYEFPQDGGNRTDVRSVEFLNKSSDRLLRARFGDLEGASFSASHYSTKDIDECKHPYELRERKREDTVVRLDWAHHGLGTASCGPWTLPEYQLTTDKEFDFEMILD